MSGIDLHMHSCFSDDGDLSPEELSDLCAANGVYLFAVSDHNNTNGVGRAMAHCVGKGIEALPAIEIDAVFHGVGFHVVGYGIDYKDQAYAALWVDILEKEREASKKRIALIRSIGIDFEDGEIDSLAKWGIVTGEMIAEAAMNFDKDHKNKLLRPYFEGGPRSGNPYVNFYWDFCSQGKPAYSHIEFMGLKEAVALVEKTGGIPVLAHPGLQAGEDRELLDAVFACGLRGIEAYSSYHSAAMSRFYADYAEQNGLLVTCGSDFHGKTKPLIPVGGVDCGGREGEIAEKLKRMLEL